MEFPKPNSPTWMTQSSSSVCYQSLNTNTNNYKNIRKILFNFLKKNHIPGVLHMVLNLLFENLPTCITNPMF
jgi:hypothetical protein